MHHHYRDIRDRIHAPPTWFDEDGVPRWGSFSPDATANIYATEIVLLKIRCQSCGRIFHVCMTWDPTAGVLHKEAPLSVQIRDKTIHYGDPPNVECCPAGPSMNSEPDRVLEFWRREVGDAVRDPSLEVSVEEEPGGNG